MSRIRFALGAAALAGAMFGGTAHADQPIPVCVDDAPANTDFCLYVHLDPPCVDGGGRIAGRPFIFRPCHL